MAVTMPSVEIIFKQLAASLIERSERGICFLIVKDDTDKNISYISLKDSTEVEDYKDKFTETNIKYIKDTLTFGASKCVVIRMSNDNYEAESEDKITLNTALKTVMKVAKTGWITIADGTPEQFSDLASWIKSKESEGYTYKAVTYKTAVTDCKHIVNFYNDKIIFNDEREEQSGVAYCSSLIGIFAACNIKRGVTYYSCDNLLSVEELEDNNTAVGEGKFILFNDEDTVKVALGINSLTTTNGITLTEDMKYIDIVEAMDMIADDIRNVFITEYLGKYKNNYDNQILFISAINAYFKELAKDYILDENYYNFTDVDVDSQRNAWLGVGKIEALEWSEQTVKNNAFKRTVFLKGDIKITGAMENLKFNVFLF